MESHERRDDLFAQLAVVGKAFGSAKRLEIIELLTQGERSVESLAQEAGLGVSTTSAHLQILRLSNLVHTRREGTKVFYRLAGEDVATLYGSLRQVGRTHSADVERALGAYLGAGEVAADVVEVGREELLARMAEGAVTLIDVRPPEEYAAGHIPGAVSLPLGDLVDHLDSLPRPGGDTEVVAYCRGAYCVLAHDAVRLLGASGIAARRLQDGLLEWRLAGHPVEAGA